MISDVEDEEYYNRPLGRWPVFVYGVGHMLNDITSACWFTYLLVFLTDIGLSPGYASSVLLLLFYFIVVDFIVEESRKLEKLQIVISMYAYFIYFQ